MQGLDWTALVFVGLVVLVILRVAAFWQLRVVLAQAFDYADQAHELGKGYRTLGDLKKAGVYSDFCELREKGGAYYRRAVTYAAFLMWWPIGPCFRVKARDF